MISPLPSSNGHAVALAGADISPAIRIVHDSDSDRVMDPDEQCDYADQGPPSDSDLDGGTQMGHSAAPFWSDCRGTGETSCLISETA